MHAPKLVKSFDKWWEVTKIIPKGDLGCVNRWQNLQSKCDGLEYINHFIRKQRIHKESKTLQGQLLWLMFPCCLIKWFYQLMSKRSS